VRTGAGPASRRSASPAQYASVSFFLAVVDPDLDLSTGCVRKFVGLEALLLLGGPLVVCMRPETSFDTQGLFIRWIISVVSV
jgi:hypothetical protein